MRPLPGNLLTAPKISRTIDSALDGRTGQRRYVDGVPSPHPTITPAPEVLAVDDEPSILDVIVSALELDGCRVSQATTGTQALALLRSKTFDLAVLDVMLPDRDGFEIVEVLRREGRHVPVLFLTARTEGASVVQGLAVGGDDYLRKPFDIDELLARAHALLRRTLPTRPGSASSFRDVVIDHAAAVARRGDRLLDLTPTERRLLEVLVAHGGQVLSKAQLIDHVWDDPAGVDEATVETVVSRLRRKLDGPGEPQLLVTRRGIGYGLLDEDR